MENINEILTAANAGGGSMYKYPANEVLKSKLINLEEKKKIHFDAYFMTWKRGAK